MNLLKKTVLITATSLLVNSAFALTSTESQALTQRILASKVIDMPLVAAKLVASGVPEEVIYERSLLGITAMEKAVGKKVFAEVLDGLIVKPEGKPTLVPEGDKRPAITSRATALDDFSN